VSFTKNKLLNVQYDLSSKSKLFLDFAVLFFPVKVIMFGFFSPVALGNAILNSRRKKTRAQQSSTTQHCTSNQEATRAAKSYLGVISF